MAFKIPQIGFGGKPVEGALEKMTGEKNTSQPARTANPPRTATSLPNDVDLENCILLEGRTHGSYSYPSMLVEKTPTYRSNDVTGENSWKEYDEMSQKSGWHMLTPRQYVDFLKTLRDGLAYNGVEDRISQEDCQQLLGETLRCGGRGRSEWLNMLFNVKLSFGTAKEENIIIIDTPRIESDGTILRNLEPIHPDTLDHPYPGVPTLNGWIDHATYQGLLSNKSVNPGSNKREGFDFGCPSKISRQVSHAAVATAKSGHFELGCTRLAMSGMYRAAVRRAYLK